MKKKLLILGIIIWGAYINGQPIATLYHLNDIPQTQNMNPARMMSYKAYMGIISGAATVNFTNPLASFITYNANQIEVQQDKLPDKMNISASGTVNVFDAGLWYKNIYYSLGVKYRLEGSVTMPGTTFNILTSTGDEGKREVNIPYANMDASSYFVYFVGGAYSWGEKFKDGKNKYSIGLRTKYLRGVRIVQGSIRNMQMATMGESATLSAQTVEINTSPIIEKNEKITPFSGGGGHGVAFDIGGIVKISDQWTVSMSATDIGTIWWKGERVAYNFDTTFLGFSLDEMSDNNLDADRLLDSNKRVEKEKSFKGGIFPTIYLGVKYVLNNKISAGALFSTKNYRDYISPSLTGSVIYSPIKYLSTVMSYTVRPSQYKNIGLGISYRHQYIQFYFMTDNVFELIPGLKAITNKNTLASISYANFTIGLNITFNHLL